MMDICVETDIIHCQVWEFRILDISKKYIRWLSLDREKSVNG